MPFKYSILVTLQIVLLASFSVTMVSVFRPPSGAMDALVDVVMAAMREDAVSGRVSRIFG